MTATTEVVISEKSKLEFLRSDLSGIARSRMSTMRMFLSVLSVACLGRHVATAVASAGAARTARRDILSPVMRLLDLQVGRLHHLAPALHLALDPLAVFGRRADHRIEADRLEPLPHL